MQRKRIECLYKKTKKVAIDVSRNSFRVPRLDSLQCFLRVLTSLCRADFTFYSDAKPRLSITIATSPEIIIVFSGFLGLQLHSFIEIRIAVLSCTFSLSATCLNKEAKLYVRTYPAERCHFSTCLYRSPTPSLRPQKAWRTSNTSS